MKSFLSTSPTKFSAGQWLVLIGLGVVVLYAVPRVLSAATPNTTR